MNKLLMALSASVLSPMVLAKPTIVTSIKPVSMVVEAIAGDRANIEQIVSSTASPHDFAMRPSDLRKIGQADVVVWVGESLERFLEKPLENAGKEKSSIEWLTLNGMTLENFAKGHDHDHHHGDEEDHGHMEEVDHHEDDHHDEDHEEHHHDDGHHHEGVNPHVWMLPNNAKVLAEAVTKRLSKLDAANASYYQANLQTFETKLAATDAQIKKAMQAVHGVPYIVFHDGYGYFEHHYGLNHAGAITVSPERQPGAKKVAELREEITEHNVKCVFSEPQFSPAIVKTLLSGTKVNTAVLDPLGSDIKLSPNAYFDFLKSLSHQFSSCLK
ncbi:High-affinity zinc uptake system protein ZnuA precursor [Marinomonas spartinae]|uniref:High-affinity zinc uptake system protein ZnuA n=1 Tax=Marinomonas spartinae TaxID=1792290 RepID=A0A1A8TJN0_9GAMM|nr:zinc ABC transporter substrate-binding protein ZnuA [Marinomonas spartinae]SBS32473.1 High-affinity zinc uptake system protein ZnuA precursor [Marinomonas spartinae]